MCAFARHCRELHAGTGFCRTARWAEGKYPTVTWVHPLTDSVNWFCWILFRGLRNTFHDFPQQEDPMTYVNTNIQALLRRFWVKLAVAIRNEQTWIDDFLLGPESHCSEYRSARHLEIHSQGWLNEENFHSSGTTCDCKYSTACYMSFAHSN